MSFEAWLFYLFALLLISSAIGVVVVRNTVYAALLLILAFFNSAALWLLLQAEFLSIVLVLVYVGAVMVLFLFIIMMLNLKVEQVKREGGKYFPFSLVVLFLLIVELIIMLQSSLFDKVITTSDTTKNIDNTAAIGLLLYKEYLFPFEVAAVILLVAIIAAIMLTLRRRGDVKTQDIEQQIQVQSSERIRLIKLPSGRQGS
ncbi:NADH-quinone oxidoreductase subunit J [Thiofilum flexile]|uniref:NADH-quinone oxidoreductase subunit J n=1 Tax=Thiofilum flexile TaxID=125627 RepID=UPI00035EB969|nr:NADH-quinone oxidoreductase subunit J [Thiofilum flexile]